MKSSPAIGLVLSGGGTRGLAHVGAWKELQRLGFTPAAIAGCSMGAIIGAMIAAGKTPEEMEAFVLEQRATKLLQWPITQLGISNLTKMERTLMTFLGVSTFEELTIPLTINATNLTSGTVVVYQTGSLWSAIRASIAVPGIFAPYRKSNQLLVDGGILHEHPFQLLPATINQFLLINCSPMERLVKQKLGVIDLLRASLNIMQNTMLQLRLAERDPNTYYVVEPNVHGRNIFESEKQYRGLMQLGADEIVQHETDIRSFLQK